VCSVRYVDIFIIVVDVVTYLHVHNSFSLQEMSDLIVGDFEDVTFRDWNDGGTDESWWKDVEPATTVVKAAALLMVVLLALGGNGLVVAAVLSHRTWVKLARVGEALWLSPAPAFGLIAAPITLISASDAIQTELTATSSTSCVILIQNKLGRGDSRRVF